MVALTVANKHEKSLNDYLKKQIQELSAEISQLKELYEDEKTKNEKITALRKQKPGEYGYLPDIHSAAAAAATAAALQQQTQMEITYQRKILSLENRYKDLTENNKRLLRKIEQLEKTEADADALISELRQDNIRLATEVDSLSSTVTSQSALIIGLRTSLNKLTQDERQISTLIKKYDRSQIDLVATKVREKLIREEMERTKLIMSKEKEGLMSKILEFQQRLQQSNLAGADAEALRDSIERLEQEKTELENAMDDLRKANQKADDRLHEQEQMTNRLLQDKEGLEIDRRNLLALVATKDELLESQDELKLKLSMLRQKGSEVDRLMLQIVDLQGVNDMLNQTNSKLRDELQSMRDLQLSHDETVRALQLARQKAATHEALALVNEERKSLEDKLRTLQSEWEEERGQLVAAKKQLEAETEFQTTRIGQLQAEIAVLRGRPAEQIIVEKILPPSAEEAEERARIEADLARLRSEYSNLRENLESMEKEYNKLVTKKYKTESFQSQVRLLQNENTELNGRLDDLLREQEQDRNELHARAMEIVELRHRVMDPEAIDMLRKTQESLEKTVSTLVEAEIASESTFTCLQCMRLFVSPMTLTPCGHTYCATCLDKLGGDVSVPSTIPCKECKASGKASDIESVFPNQSLADLTARFIFRQQTLSSMTTMCLSLRNSFATRSGT
ncbi:hypothetical protein Poli38472_003847 [Pythium oligandrum]|uniref:RING-type domain-containing protein n=1 Tax=Pythium oligandrum TaxID=41045 RepID=A0A8K1CM65_PYTOL|nr:hypothetical protein Poli38472_003847 [Pythium oligandrum]|eukprot:TMW66082.1 hypothetical protein Poli38472_003847 [Pythium oligandrum]